MSRHIHKHLIHKTSKKTEKKEFADYLVRFFMIATPMAELPQAYTIYHAHSAKDVSLFTWAFFAMSSTAWLLYGVKHKLFPLIVAQSLYLVVESSVVFGVILYS